MEAISDYLLESRLYDSITLARFKEFFPSKYRDTQDVKTLYKDFLNQRKRKRDVVSSNLNEQLDFILEETLQKLDPSAQPIDEVIEVLLIKEKELKREMRFLEDTSKNYFQYFERYQQELAEVDLEAVKKTKIDLENTKKLCASLQQLG